MQAFITKADDGINLPFVGWKVRCASLLPTDLLLGLCPSREGVEEVVEEVSVEVSAKEGLVFPKEGAWWEKPKDRVRCPKYDRLQRTEARKTNKECQNIRSLYFHVHMKVSFKSHTHYGSHCIGYITWSFIEGYPFKYSRTNPGESHFFLDFVEWKTQRKGCCVTPCPKKRQQCGGSNIYCGTSHAWTHAYCRSVNQRRGWFLF